MAEKGKIWIEIAAAALYIAWLCKLARYGDSNNPGG
jgi:hypothetical protein